MAKGFNMSSFNSKMHQIQRKVEREINSELNKVTRKFESDVNREIRKYNSQIRKNQQIVSRELSKLKSHSTIRSTYTISLDAMHQHYIAIGNSYDDDYVTPQQKYIFDLIEQEQANGIITANAIQNNEFPYDDTSDIEIGDKLASVSEDLNNRWKGAVYALNPINPDASRHFCTSAREIFTEFIEIKAPDNLVLAFDPDCDKTPERKTPTRRAKIKYMMRNLDIDPSAVDFADADITNILELFHILSDGTHGEAGRYETEKLNRVKKRVEQGINFLCEISRNV